MLASPLQLPGFLFSQPHTHQEGITIFMLSVTGIRGLGGKARRACHAQGGKEATAEDPGGDRAALRGPSQQAGPVFKVLPGNLPRGAGGCGWGISSSDGEAQPSARW